MLLRRLLPIICALLLIPAAASASMDTAGAGPSARSHLYLPGIAFAEAEAPLSKITGLSYSYYDWYTHTGFDQEIYTVRADGSQLARLTDNTWQDRWPTWSHDGRYIAWTQTGSTSPSSHQEAWIMKSDGSNAHNAGSQPIASPAAWSPVEDKLLIRQNDARPTSDQKYSLYIATPDTASPVLVASSLGLGSCGWSPSGDFIWFDRISTSLSIDLYTAHADGSHVTLVASDYAGPPIWSPDGLWLAYSKNAGASMDVYVSHGDGTGARVVAATPYNEEPSGWVEGGARLLVTRVISYSDQTSQVNLYSIAGGTTSPFLASDPPGRYAVMGVSPNGRVVAYTDIEHQDGTAYSVLKLKNTGALPGMTISPPLLGSGNIAFAGWSYDGRQVAYAHSVSWTPGASTSQLYVANVDGVEPAYWMAQDDASDPIWLPQSTWLSVYGPYDGTYLYRPRSGSRTLLPRSAEDPPLIVREWQLSQ